MRTELVEILFHNIINVFGNALSNFVCQNKFIITPYGFYNHRSPPSSTPQPRLLPHPIPST